MPLLRCKWSTVQTQDVPRLDYICCDVLGRDGDLLRHLVASVLPLYIEAAPFIYAATLRTNSTENQALNTYRITTYLLQYDCPVLCIITIYFYIINKQ